MEEHEVQTIILNEIEEFKGKEVSFDGTYEYCDRVDENIETEDIIKANNLAMKDGYKKEQFINIGLDFIDILGWGRATI